MDRERELEFVEFPAIIVDSCQIRGGSCPPVLPPEAPAAVETPNSQAPASQSLGSRTMSCCPAGRARAFETPNSFVFRHFVVGCGSWNDHRDPGNFLKGYPQVSLKSG